MGNICGVARRSSGPTPFARVVTREEHEIFDRGISVASSRTRSVLVSRRPGIEGNLQCRVETRREHEIVDRKISAASSKTTSMRISHCSTSTFQGNEGVLQCQMSIEDQPITLSFPLLATNSGESSKSAKYTTWPRLGQGLVDSAGPYIESNPILPTLKLPYVNSRDEAYHILEDLMKTNAKKNNLEGLVFSKINFAAAIVGEEGASMSFSDQSVTLNIPEKALKKEQEIMMYSPLKPDDIIHRCDGKPFIPYTSFIHCGPEGTKFEQPVVLSFPHSAVFGAQNEEPLHVIRRANSASPWTEVGAEDIHIYRNRMNVTLTGFSDTCGGSYSGSIPRSTCLASVVRRYPNGNLNVDVYLCMATPESGRMEETLSEIRKYPENQSGCEITHRLIKIDLARDIEIEGHSEQMIFLRNRIIIPSDELRLPTCRAEFKLSNQHGQSGAAATNGGTDVIKCTIHISQTRMAPWATVIVTDAEVKIDVNEALVVHILTQDVETATNQVPQEARELSAWHSLHVTPGRFAEPLKETALDNVQRVKRPVDSAEEDKPSTVDNAEEDSRGSPNQHDQQRVEESPVDTAEEDSRGSLNQHDQQRVEESPVDTAEEDSRGSPKQHDQQRIEESPGDTAEEDSRGSQIDQQFIEDNSNRMDQGVAQTPHDQATDLHRGVAAAVRLNGQIHVAEKDNTVMDCLAPLRKDLDTSKHH